MSVPRKGRLPAWHLLTDEGGSVNSRCLSALFPSAAQAHAAAEVLERRGALLLAMETEPRSTPQPLRRFPNLVGLDLTHCLRGVRAFACSRDNLCAWSRLRASASCARDLDAGEAPGDRASPISEGSHAQFWRRPPQRIPGTLAV
jgi:hypothetical protein